MCILVHLLLLTGRVALILLACAVRVRAHLLRTEYLSCLFVNNTKADPGLPRRVIWTSWRRKEQGAEHQCSPLRIHRYSNLFLFLSLPLLRNLTHTDGATATSVQAVLPAPPYSPSPAHHS